MPPEPDEPAAAAFSATAEQARLGPDSAVEPEALDRAAREVEHPTEPEPHDEPAESMPAEAAPSNATVVSMVGPVMINSRCDEPTRKKW